MMAFKKLPSHSWWFDSHNSQRRSAWLQSTLSELDEKTTAMLKLIEEDADSFAQRAEMYYKKRPELVNMVEDFYRAHRSLAERFDQLKSESKSRVMGSPFTPKYQSQKLTTSPMEKSYDSYSETFDSEVSGESEVDDPDPEQEEESQVHRGMEEEEEEGEEEVSSGVSEGEVMKLRDEIERLKEENKNQKEELLEKDEEKREVIRQLCLAMEIMKENVNLSKNTVKEPIKKWNPFEFNKLKGIFSGKLFKGSSKSQTTSVVAL